MIRAIVLIAVTVVAFLPTVRAGYIWDDDDHVYNNPTLRSVEGLGQVWTEIGATPQYYPLTHTTFWLEYQLWGDAPAGYHINNILLHVIVSLLLWRVLVLLNVPGAWLAAVVFAVHPMQAESVAWITERKNVLSGVFYVASAWAFLRWVLPRLDQPDKPRAGGLYVLALLLYLFALMSKTITCTLPAGLLVVLWWKHGKLARREVLAVLPMLLLGLGFAIVTVLMEQHVVGAKGGEWEYSLVERGLIAGRALWFYPMKFVWPWPLIFIYPKWPVESGAVWQYLLPIAAMVTFITLWLLRRRIGRGPAAVAAFYAITISPALGFFNVYPMLFSFVADHFSYLACIGLSVGLVGGGSVLAQRLKMVRPASVLALLVVGVCTFLSSQRCLALQDAETLWQDTLAKNPGAWMAYNNLGLIHMNRGENELARKNFEQVLELRPNAVRAMNNLGSLSLMAGHLEEARDYFEQTVELEPNFVGARLNLSKTLLSLGQAQPASENYLHALEVDPKVGEVEEQLALILLNTLDAPDADAFFNRAIKARPDWVLLINEMAWLLATDSTRKSQSEISALKLATQAADLSGYTDPNILDTLAAAYAANGEYTEAITNAQKAKDLAERNGDFELSKEVARRLNTYQQLSGDPPAHTHPAPTN